MSDLASAQRNLQQLELDLISLPALAANSQPSPTTTDELLLARGVYEQAVLLGTLRSDLVVFQRSWSQLAPYYIPGDLSRSLTPSPRQAFLTALNLLRLLSQAAVAEFHAELELLSDEIMEVEAWLMEGAYNRVLEAQDALSTSPYTAIFLQRLTDTVREEVAACCERSYASLNSAEALKLFRLESEAQLEELAQGHGWRLTSGRVEFAGPDEGGGLPAPVSQDIISNCMLYAKELERIV
ncbi:26S proteasome non-ATPase regulatory subunit 8-like protein A [Auxenochlorella protothecoides]|uniref:26S proteasome non-ATPase regulatory subunit 8-like protein A n=1 Tax=Auxenochlorella protothecoides TaxID=3075 RepID=A0A087S9G0_AUXPR|nr:26S proteasome non-ATPase regulatory subunit 8-like protein A [Auxenochlorella protothecoides]KFM22364.1 26S proteasome non-ATPase regulatory subunit 8-like protein A [Auxenochlorella protothecoides]